VLGGIGHELDTVTQAGRTPYLRRGPVAGGMERRSPGQVLALFALLILVLLGFVGLSVDGGYYFAVARATTIAADTAARAAATDVRRAQNGGPSSLYAQATSDGQAIGRMNLGPMRLTGVTFIIEYNDTPNADPAGSGWSAGSPTATTRSVKATATGNYATLFLGAVGIPSMQVQRLGQGAPTSAVVTIERVLPLGQCNLLRSLLPGGPWTLYSDLSPLASLCSLLWNGLVDLDGTAINCGVYDGWVGPPVAGPGPSTGTAVRLDTRRCGSLGSRLRNLNGTQQSVVIVDTANGNRVLGCQRVQLSVQSVAGVTTVTGTPIGGMGQCTVRQNS
jgi:hypothetical protein